MNVDNDSVLGLDYIDHRFGIPSYKKYKIDAQYKNFSKLCMSEVVNADVSIASFGEDAYAAGCAEVLMTIKTYLESCKLEKSIFLYAHSYKRFILVADDSITDEAFKTAIDNMFKLFEHANAAATPISGVSRFVLVFGDNIVNRALSAHHANINNQINYILENHENEICLADLTEKVEIFQLIAYAIQHNTITPFYQGIRNNKSGEINKFEALMRLYDEKGKMYSPDYFMRVAKEFNQYNTISKMMIKKALNDFVSTDKELCINITLFDIQNEDFRTWFINKIETYPSPQRLTLEFVETENYNSNSILFDFLQEARSIGCKIAADDFGSGFATFSSIISLKPDIIKIDGDIIKHLVDSEENRIILDSICFIARQINSHIVAEYVESDEIQKILLERDIEFSQGFHFATPLPISDIIDV